MYALAETLVRLDEHIKVKNQDVKSRRMAERIEKTANFQIENQLVPSFETINFWMGTNWKREG